jgi:hypothetical protein
MAIIEVERCASALVEASLLCSERASDFVCRELCETGSVYRPRFAKWLCEGELHVDEAVLNSFPLEAFA